MMGDGTLKKPSMNEEELLAWSLDQLKWSLQALALPYDAQRRLFPSFASTGDELALDFDHWCETARHQHAFTADQLSELASVSVVLSAMTDEKNPELWSDSALAHLPRWQDVRDRARKALETFRWNLDVPPSDRAVFIPSGPEKS
jgi:hypothetical protein